MAVTYQHVPNFDGDQYTYWYTNRGQKTRAFASCVTKTEDHT